ncbi:aromatic ring-opening dioxygenase LigA [Streptomyces sp. NPDC058254]|uniref:aromatic ring-opening dioxygenase LigA n=1 Tax=Streptomyces sp. NPDC058254 TaxID=3346406 RepID=UPI0036E230C9
MTARTRLDRAARLLDTPPASPVPGQLAVEVDDRPPVVCGHGNPRCGAVPVRPYPCGPRCDEHQPAKTRPFYGTRTN